MYPTSSPYSGLHDYYYTFIAHDDILSIAFLDLLNVPGATGDYRTDLMAKAHQALNTLMNRSFNYDMGFIHIKAVDDCGHDRNVRLKIEFLEKIDTMIGMIHQRIFQEITSTSSKVRIGS